MSRIYDKAQRRTTVRTLINELLDKDMDAEVVLETYDPNRTDVSGVLFHIDYVTRSRSNPTIMFTDWRSYETKRGEEE